MEFSLEVVSIHQMVEPAPNMKMLLVWQNVNQIKTASLRCRQDGFRPFADLSDQPIFCLLHNYAAMPLWF